MASNEKRSTGRYVGGQTERDQEIKLVDIYSDLSLSDPQLTLPFNLWRGEIDNRSALVIGTHQGATIATRNKYGKGTATWIPSLIGLGAWQRDNTALTQLLLDVTKPFIQKLTFRFQSKQNGCIMRVMQKGNEFVTIITNGTTDFKELDLEVQEALNAKVLWGRKAAVNDNGRSISLNQGKRWF